MDCIRCVVCMCIGKGCIYLHPTCYTCLEIHGLNMCGVVKKTFVDRASRMDYYYCLRRESCVRTMDCIWWGDNGKKYSLPPRSSIHFTVPIPNLSALEVYVLVSMHTYAVPYVCR